MATNTDIKTYGEYPLSYPGATIDAFLKFIEYLRTINFDDFAKNNEVENVEVLIEKLIYEVNDNGYYTNPSPTPTTLGGIKSGTTFDNESVKNILGKLLYPYVAFAISTSAATSYLEYGNTATIASVSVTIKKGSADISSFVITAGSADISNSAAITTLNALASENSVLVSTTINYTTPATSDGVISISVSDGTTATTKILRTYKHVYPYYHGVVNEDDVIDSSMLLSFGASGKDITSKGIKTYTYTLDNQLPVYACPSSYGEVSVTDAATGTPYTFNKTEITVTNSYGQSAVYYVYKLSKPVTGTFTFKFTHS